MQLQMTFLKSFLRSFYPSVFDDLEELIIIIWWKIHRDGDTLRLIKWKFLQRAIFRSYTNSVFIKLKDNYIDYFGVSAKYKSYLDLVRKLAIHKSKLSTTGDRWHVGQIMICEEKLKAFNDQSKPRDEYQSLIDVKMMLGNMPIDPNTASVIEYGAHEKKAIEINKRTIADNNARKAKRKR